MYGSFLTPHLQHFTNAAGVRLGAATVISPGVNVHYVRSTGANDYDPPELTGRIHTTLNAALGQCRSGAGDVVVCLSGHTESIATADAMSNLKAGTKIIGLGDADERPTFTWTAAAATFLLDVANVTIENCILLMDPGAGAVNVAAPITVSAAGCKIRRCRIRMGTDANSLVTIGLTTTAGATGFEFDGNEVYGATAAECTTMIQFVGAVRLKFRGNSVVGATSNASVGVIRFLTTASTDIKMFDNVVRNNKAGGGAGDQAITGMAGISGEVDYLFMTVLGNNAANLTGAIGTPASLTFGSNVYVANTIAERAALFGTVSA